MADRLSAYADWLVSNQNLQGTPQFQTVADAYRQLRQQGNQSTTQEAKPDTSFSSAFMQGIDRPLENIGTTLQATGLAPNVGQALKDATQAPTNYESASEKFINPDQGDFTIAGYAPEYLPRAIVEQAGNLGGSLISRAGGAAAGGLVAGPAGAVGGALAGPALFEFAQQLGPVAIERAKNNGRSEPTWDDWTAAAATAGVSGGLNALGVGGGKGASLLNKTLREGTTETAQSVTEQTGTTAGTDKGLQIDPRQAVGEGIIGGTTAGSFDVAGKAVTAPGKLVAEEPVQDQQAATGFANDLQRIAENEGYDLKDVGTGANQGARAAIDDLHVEYASDIDLLVGDLKDRLKITDDDSRAVAFKKVKANAAKRKAKNKVKSRVDPSDIRVIEELAGDTAEGAELIALMRKSNELSALANKSLKGGLSQFTDIFNPFDTDGRYNIGRVIAAPVSSFSALSTSGASLVPAVLGRGVDAITGRRSRVARYVRDNQGQGGIQIDPKLPSVRTGKALDRLKREQEKQRLAQERIEVNQALAAQGAPATLGSPQATVEEATGLDREGVEAALARIEASNPLPAIQRAINEYRKSVEQGGTITNKMLSPIIRNIKLVVENNQDLADRQVRPPTVEEQVDVISDGRREAGKQDNLRFLNDLEQKVKDDRSLSVSDKARAIEAIGTFRFNLGANPVETIETLIEAAVANAKDPQKVRTYLTSYLARVKRQQRSSKFVSETKSKVTN
jgi:hypothetical protein